jgi:hypothetical protein
MGEAPVSTFVSWVISWGAISLFAVTLLGVAVGVLSMNPPQFVLAQVCFTASALVLTARVAWWLAIEQSNPSIWHRVLLSALILGTTGVLWIEAVSWVQRLKIQHELTLKFIFSNSSLLTESRKRTVALEIQQLRNYLSNVGFEVPHTVPPIQINMVGGIVASGQSEYGYTLFFTDKTIDNATAVAGNYAYYVFFHLLRTPQTDMLEDPNRWTATMIFAEYFVSSFENRRHIELDKWNSALWELREELGHDFMDHALLFTVKLFDNLPYNKKEEWNKFFRLRLERGLLVMDNPGNSWKSKLDAVVEKYKLTSPEPSSSSEAR